MPPLGEQVLRLLTVVLLLAAPVIVIVHRRESIPKRPKNPVVILDHRSPWQSSAVSLVGPSNMRIS